MAKDKFLKQARTGRVYLWTPALALRRDMAEYDPEIAKTRIAALKRRLEELENMPARVIEKQVLDDAAEISDLESEIERKEQEIQNAAMAEAGQKTEPESLSEEEIARQEREKIIGEDPEIKKIQEFRSKKEVVEYMETEFGETADDKAKLDELKARAFTLRADRLFEDTE